jgi:hypothetical protein
LPVLVSFQQRDAGAKIVIPFESAASSVALINSQDVMALPIEMRTKLLPSHEMGKAGNPPGK